MTRVFAFKGQVFCGVFNIFSSPSDWKSAFCINNGFEMSSISVLELSESDMDKYDIIMRGSNTSRVIFDKEIKIIGTHLVDDKEVIVETFTPTTII